MSKPCHAAPVALLLLCLLARAREGSCTPRLLVGGRGRHPLFIRTAYRLGLRVSGRPWVSTPTAATRLPEEDREPQAIAPPAPGPPGNPQVWTWGVGVSAAGLVVVWWLLSHQGGGDQADASLLWERLSPPGYSFWGSLLSGTVAGIARGLSRIVTFPLDTVKTRYPRHRQTTQNP
jgi:hypothetical protein